MVVYKVDRLTRSLTDFAKLIELFEAAGCQLCLGHAAVQHHHLDGPADAQCPASFAQFEREVTGERIRDKIAASKKKGLWMGGICSPRLRR